MLTIEIEPAGTVPAAEEDLIGLIRTLGALHDHTPLQWFRWDVTADPTVFDYKIRAVDGPARMFTQVYTFDGSPEEPLIKTGGDAWTLVEINLHRDIRTYTLALFGAYAVTKIHATF